MNTQKKNEYMFLFRGNDWCNHLSPEEMQKVASQWMAWFKRLSEDIEQLAEGDQWHTRLVTLQNSLVDLINLLDPESIRFPDRHRKKLQIGAAVN